MPTKTAGRKPKYTVEVFKRILQGPLELVIDGAEAYWLEDGAGQEVPPASDRTLAPLYLALGLILQGRDPDGLTLYARLQDGERYRITSGISLVSIAEHAAGIKGRPRTPGVGPMRVVVSPSRRVVVDPNAWRHDPATGVFPKVEVESILFSPTSISHDGAALEQAGNGPTEIVLSGSGAYWLEDRDGRRIGPESDRSLAPMYLAVGLAREGREPYELTFWVRLVEGQRFEIGRGPSLIELASRATGLPLPPGLLLQAKAQNWTTKLLD